MLLRRTISSQPIRIKVQYKLSIMSARHLKSALQSDSGSAPVDFHQEKVQLSHYPQVWVTWHTLTFIFELHMPWYKISHKVTFYYVSVSDKVTCCYINIVFILVNSLPATIINFLFPMSACRPHLRINNYLCASHIFKGSLNATPQRSQSCVSHTQCTNLCQSSNSSLFLLLTSFESSFLLHSPSLLLFPSPPLSQLVPLLCCQLSSSCLARDWRISLFSYRYIWVSHSMSTRTASLTSSSITSWDSWGLSLHIITTIIMQICKVHFYSSLVKKNNRVHITRKNIGNAGVKNTS